MPFVPIEDVAEVVTFATNESAGGPDTIVNTHYVLRDDGTWDASRLSDLLDGVETWWDSSVAPVTDSSNTLTRLKAVDQTVEAGIAVEHTVSIPGTRSGAGAPVAVCAVVLWRGQNPGLPRRAMNFHSGAVDGDMDEFNFSDTFRADVAEAYSDLAVAIQAVSIHYVLVATSRFAGYTIASRSNGTRYKKPTPRAAGLVNPIEAATVRAKIGIQKKRRG